MFAIVYVLMGIIVLGMIGVAVYDERKYKGNVPANEHFGTFFFGVVAMGILAFITVLAKA